MENNKSLSSEDSVTLPEFFSLEEEQVRSLYRSLPLSILSSVCIAIILSTSHWNIIGQAEIIVWNIFLGITLLTRLILWLFWQNARPMYPPRFWLICFRISTWLTGAAWGSAAMLIFAKENATYQALLTFSLAGVASGSLTSLTVDKPSSLGFVILVISPLTLAIFLNGGPTALPMSAMTLLFIFFVTASVARTRRGIEKQLKRNFELLKLSKTIDQRQQIEKAINIAQSVVIADDDVKAALQALLKETLLLTESDLGFVSEVDATMSIKPFMRVLVFTRMSKDGGAMEKFKKTNMPTNSEFHNLNNLFGTLLLSDEPVISSHFSRDMRAAPLPPGHPHIDNFIGIPIFYGKDKVAILGLANSPQGYTQDITEKLSPILKTIAQFILTQKHEQRHAHDIAALEANTKHTETILNDIGDGVITIDQRGIILSFNHAAETIFGYKSSQIIGENVSQLMPEPHRSQHNQYISNHLRTGKKTILGRGREVIGLRRNGRSFPMDLMVSRLTQNGEPVFIGIFRDISEQKRLEDLRRDFIISTSTKLQPIISTLSESIAILREEDTVKSVEQQHRCIEVAHQSTVSLKNVLSNLMDAQYLIPGSTPHNIHPVKFMPLVEKVVATNADFAALHNKNLHIAQRADLLEIWLDAAVFEQTFSFLHHAIVKLPHPYQDIRVIAVENRGKAKVILAATEQDTETIIESRASDEKINAILFHNLKSTYPFMQTLEQMQQVCEASHGHIFIHAEKDHDYILSMEFPLARINVS